MKQSAFISEIGCLLEAYKCGALLDEAKKALKEEQRTPPTQPITAYTSSPTASNTDSGSNSELDAEIARPKKLRRVCWCWIKP